MRAVLLILALCALAPACRNKPGKARFDQKQIEVGRLTVSWVSVLDEMTVERDEVKEKRLKKILADRVSSHPRVTAGVTDHDPLELAVVAGTTEYAPDALTDAGGEVTLATLTLRTTWQDGWRISSSVLTDLPSEKPADTAPIIDDLLDDLVAQLDLFDLEVEELIALLEKRDCTYDDVCSMAVRILGESSNSSAVPVLVAKLEKTATPDPLMEDLVGALGRLGDQRASPALVDAFGRAEPTLHVAILNSIEKTGGKEAKLFLEVVASGHESLVIRERARSALESMDKPAR